ncbi:hypothetical protein SPRG_19304 [Saprolegnia parasitica CBS 223.65]|uniref:Uncharacterized protein n=1 Tax=Saprolegnia parasitica (strain CBS 223.65) TaxID=695850 RepID=A0A067CT88_SAPPC|nr:hypothetical protein SPRG_19304 [Saprolegnia parasitica CBS 223.65]KDO33693.1 hypothetical protein SPRG_19304 [Saprolegnia parasitica CBS 223.65]|eukprot:XP_012195716.1 hypothetical protein SPRG_19304 [Saprolegnia parasitica CBS 223.65]
MNYLHPGFNLASLPNPNLMMGAMQSIAARPPPRAPDEPKLQVLKEVAVAKHSQRNVLSFQVKAGAGVLYSIMQPTTIAYEAPDVTWVKLLEAVALIPSGRPHEILQLLHEAHRLLPLGDFRILFARDFRDELASAASVSSARDGIVLKNKVNVFLRAFMADPIHGYTLAKQHVHDDLYVDDPVSTPVGPGLVRGYRSNDGFFVVLFPFGHAYIHEGSLRRVPSRLLNDLLAQRRGDAVVPRPLKRRKEGL